MSLALDGLTGRQAVKITYQVTDVTDAAPATPASSPTAKPGRWLLQGSGSASGHSRTGA
jgi:hypothetical protein